MNGSVTQNADNAKQTAAIAEKAARSARSNGGLTSEPHETGAGVEVNLTDTSDKDFERY
ncbi:MAG: hypothetical protein V2A77_05610 [Pseudomonadota bacterium]